MKYSKFEEFAKLTNIQAGHHADIYGTKSVEEIEAQYGAEFISRDDLLKLEHKIVVINVNQTFGDGRSLYDATRKSWKMSWRRINKAEYVLSEYRGIIRAVFKPTKWFIEDTKEKRKYFEGEEVKEKKLLDCYINRMIDKKKGAQNPLRYYNF
ncbi:MAG: hypothetical protein KAH48_06060 [Chlorobi bacterium]|nr:hypothetical protein [Chlorobiota bacterium]